MPKLEDPYALRFDEVRHQYFFGKRRIPGVSEILTKVGLTRNYDGVDPFYRERGKATHKAIELHLKGNLDPDSLHPAVKPCFDAFRAYCGVFQLGKILHIETPMIDKSEGFAGTPDLVTERAIFDWKCSKNHDKVADLQGQAYKKMVGDLHKPFIVLELHDDGSCAPFDYGNGWNQWGSVMSLYRWKVGK